VSGHNLTQITPMLQVADVGWAVRFFVDVLGFHAWVEAWDYAYLQREGVAVRLHYATPDDEAERQHFGPRAFLFYVDVKDVDALVLEIGPKLAAAGLGAGQGPVDQMWGQREWWVAGPEGGLIVFGQAIARESGVGGSEKQIPSE
jgi:catechol 2,3-dioxygenase-like lactoylglutathione lyase family enzyme